MPTQHCPRHDQLRSVAAWQAWHARQSGRGEPEGRSQGGSHQQVGRTTTTSTTNGRSAAAATHTHTHHRRRRRRRHGQEHVIVVVHVVHVIVVVVLTQAEAVSAAERSIGVGVGVGIGDGVGVGVEIGMLVVVAVLELPELDSGCLPRHSNPGERGRGGSKGRGQGKGRGESERGHHRGGGDVLAEEATHSRRGRGGEGERGGGDDGGSGGGGGGRHTTTTTRGRGGGGGGGLDTRAGGGGGGEGEVVHDGRDLLTPGLGVVHGRLEREAATITTTTTTTTLLAGCQLAEGQEPALRGLVHHVLSAGAGWGRRGRGRGRGGGGVAGGGGGGGEGGQGAVVVGGGAAVFGRGADPVDLVLQGVDHALQAGVLLLQRPQHLHHNKHTLLLIYNTKNQTENKQTTTTENRDDCYVLAFKETNQNTQEVEMERFLIKDYKYKTKECAKFSGKCFPSTKRQTDKQIINTKCGKHLISLMLLLQTCRKFNIWKVIKPN